MTRWIVLLCVMVVHGGCDQQDAATVPPAGAKVEAQYQGKRLSRWVQELVDQDVHRRRRAAKALGEMGDGALAGLPELEQALARPGQDAVVRFLAAVSIWQLTDDVGRVMPALLSMLRSEDLDVRYRGAMALQIIGPPALAAAPPLRKVIETYGALDYSKLSYDEQLLLATARDAMDSIEGRAEPD